MDFKCLKCDRTFYNIYNLNRHKKNPCKAKLSLKCDTCNLVFRCNKEQERHEKTNRHIINNTINIDNHIDNSISNYINNNLNIKFPVNSLRNTNLDLIDEGYIDCILSKISPYITRIASLENENFKCTSVFIKSLVNIIEEINFNNSIKKLQNNNIKFLLIVNTVNQNQNGLQYLILELDAENQYYWKPITYYEFIQELFILIDSIRNRFDISKLNFIMDYLNVHFRDNLELITEYKENIEGNLDKLTHTHIATIDVDKTNKFISDETRLYTGARLQIKNN